MAIPGMNRITNTRFISHLFRLHSTLSQKSSSNLLCSPAVRTNVIVFGHNHNLHPRLFSDKSTSTTKATATTTEGFEELDKPIKFSTSKAASWSAEQSFTGERFPDTPWMQPYIVILSTSIFMLYFLVFREENDLDEEIGKPLWERIPGLEKSQLKVVYNYNVEHNIDNAAILARLKELELKEEQEKKISGETEKSSGKQ